MLFSFLSWLGLVWIRYTICDAGLGTCFLIETSYSKLQTGQMDGNCFLCDGLQIPVATKWLHLLTLEQIKSSRKQQKDDPHPRSDKPNNFQCHGSALMLKIAPVLPTVQPIYCHRLLF